MKVGAGGTLAKEVLEMVVVGAKVDRRVHDAHEPETSRVQRRLGGRVRRDVSRREGGTEDQAAVARE